MRHVLRVSACLAIMLSIAPAISAQPATDCPQFSGRWQIDPASSCRLVEGIDGDLSIHLPNQKGFILPGLPAVVEIEQRGCSSIRFRVIENDAHRPSHDFAGVVMRFDLHSDDTRAVSWDETSLSVRQMVEPQGSPIFRGSAERWADWSLERTNSDEIEYRYDFTEKGATFYAFPFEDAIGSTCRFRRSAEGSGP